MNEATMEILRSLIRTGRLLDTRMDGILHAAGLNASKLWALELLGEAGQAPLTPGDLAHRLSFVKSNATQLLDALEAAQMVRRLPAPRDRRCTLLALTEQGRQGLAQGGEVIDPFLESVEAMFSPQELEQLAEYVQRLARLVSAPAGHEGMQSGKGDR